MKYVLTAIDDWGRCYYNSTECDVVSDIKNATFFNSQEAAEKELVWFKHYLSNIKHDKNSFEVQEVSGWREVMEPGVLYSSALKF